MVNRVVDMEVFILVVGIIVVGALIVVVRVVAVVYVDEGTSNYIIYEVMVTVITRCNISKSVETTCYLFI